MLCEAWWPEWLQRWRVKITASLQDHGKRLRRMSAITVKLNPNRSNSDGDQTVGKKQMGHLYHSDLSEHSECSMVFLKRKVVGKTKGNMNSMRVSLLLFL